MKNKTLITISMLVLLLFSWFSVSSAQRSSAVLDKLNKIESRIDRLESARKNDIVKLERKLANISPAEDPSVLTGSIEGLQQKVENLKIELNELRNIQASSSSGPETEIMEDLLTDLRGLTWELRSTLTTAEEPSFEVAVEPETELTLPGVDISGFCNLLYDDDTNGTGFGQLEIDLEAEVAENIVIASAICYDAESEAFGSGALVIDFHLFGSEGSHFRPAQNVDHSGIIVGQFDVPFGIDLNYYPSIDRKLVSGPLVVGNTHDGWNDIGVIGYGEAGKYNAVVYVVNGFSYDTGVVDAAGDPVMSDVKMSAGGRLGIKPNDIVEVGASYASFTNDDSKADMSLLGFDIQAEFEALTVKGEYITHTMGIAGNSEVTNSGLYGQGTYQLEKFFFVARYGTFASDDPTADDLARITGGIGYVIREGCEVRLEYQTNSDDIDLTFLQLVVGF